MIVEIRKYGATWCGPCRILDKTLDEFSKKHPEVKVIRYDVDEMEEYELEELHIRNVPVMCFINQDDVEEKRLIGAKSIQEIENELS